MTRGTVVVFARAPERGRVKTRLARTLGDDATLALYRAFLADTLAAARASGARVLLAHTPAPPFAEQGLAHERFAQRGETFGERFDAALADARRLAPQGPLALVAADTPHLGPLDIRAALAALSRADAAIGPVPGGGFYLLGFAGRPAPVAPAFEAARDGPAVAALLAARGLSLATLPPIFDVDDASDLDALERHLAGGPAWRPALTSETLQVAVGGGRVGSPAKRATPSSNATSGS